MLLEGLLLENFHFKMILSVVDLS